MENKINITKKDLYWNYLSYSLSFGINILILPLILHFISSQELGLWYVYLSINSFILLLDFGFSSQIARTITYVYSGLKKIPKQGIAPILKLTDTDIDIELLKNTILICKRIYLIIGSVSLIFLLGGGIPYIHWVWKGENFNIILSSWLIYSAGAFLNLFYCYYNSIFKGLGEFTYLSKSIIFSKLIYVIIVIITLCIGLGILGLSISFFLSTIILRFSLIFYFKNRIKVGVLLSSFKIKLTPLFFKENFKKIWHNTWKEGFITISKFINSQANTILCSLYINLTQTATYALSVQIVMFVVSVSSIHYTTIHPSLLQEQINANKKRRSELLSLSWVIYVITFLVIIILVTTLGNIIFKIIESQTHIEIPLFLFIALYLFLEYNHSLFTSYISTSNNLPYLKSVVLASSLSLLVSIILVQNTTWGIWALIIPPFLCQLLYNNWKWPSLVLREFNTNLSDFFIQGLNQVKVKLHLLLNPYKK